MISNGDIQIRIQTMDALFKSKISGGYVVVLNAQKYVIVIAQNASPVIATHRIVKFSGATAAWMRLKLIEDIRR